MRYRLAGGEIIRSENAAKTHHQKSKELLRLLSRFQRVARTLDFGCGKLRYLSEILDTTDHLYVTDSEVQLTRTQRLFGQMTSIRDLVRLSNAWSVLSLKELYCGDVRFNRIFCLNVLQVIPFRPLRQAILRRLANVLDNNGEIVVVVQYRNSDFSRMSRMENASPFEDGMLLRFSRGVSFYAFIKPPVLEQMVREAGLTITHKHVHDGSCYIIATRKV
jgi:hypothetical protein